MAKLRRNLGVLEAIGLSLSIIAPTMAMAFNTTLAVQSAGRAAPLAFLIGTIALAIVGLSFVAFGRRVAHAGSAYAYITHAFGPRLGFVTGWALMLTYLTYATGTAALIGNFIGAAFGIGSTGFWLTISVLGMLLAILLAWRDMRIAARLMLALEGISVVAILVLALIVLLQAPLSAAPFRPAPDSGWSGVGYGMVFAVLSFAGFEGAATLGEEAREPRRAIPIAIMGTVLMAGAFYVLVSYAQVVGYGLDHMQALGQADAPLDALSTRYVARWFAVLIDFAAAISAFSCTLGSLAAAARMLYALGRAGLSRPLGSVDPRHGTPANAVFALGLVCIAGLVLWGARAGAGNYYGAMGTIGTLALILVYMGVTGAEMVEARRVNRTAWAALGLVGTVLLLWPLWNSVYPVPAWPGNLWPYLVVAWLIAGVLLLLARPALAQVDLAALEAEPDAA